jgi:hypothetical protein
MPQAWSILQLADDVEHLEAEVTACIVGNRTAIKAEEIRRGRIEGECLRATGVVQVEQMSDMEERQRPAYCELRNVKGFK